MVETLVATIFESADAANNLNTEQNEALLAVYKHAFEVMLRDLKDEFGSRLTQQQWITSLRQLVQSSDVSQILLKIALKGKRPTQETLLPAFEKHNLLQEETMSALNIFADVLLLQLRLHVSDEQHPLYDLLPLEALNNVDPYRAVDYYHQLLPPLREVDDKQSEAAVLVLISNVHVSMGKTRQAFTDLGQALALYHELDDQLKIAKTLRRMGVVYSTLGDIDEALTYTYDALVVYQQAGDLEGQASTLNDIGIIYDKFDDNEKALSYYSQALKMHRRIGNARMQATALHNMANVYEQLGDKQQAIICYNKALPLRREAGDKHGEAATVFNMSFLVKEKSHALKLTQQAYDLWMEVDSPLAQELAEPRLRALRE